MADQEDPALDDLNTTLGVPPEARACHTAIVDGYAVVGHVPAEAIRALLETRPAARGISVPGMPSDAPGMGGDPATWADQPVMLIGTDGGLTPFDF